MDLAAQIQIILRVATTILLTIIMIGIGMRLGWAAYLAHVDRHIERKRAAARRAYKDHKLHG